MKRVWREIALMLLFSAIITMAFVLWSYPIIRTEVNATHRSMGR